MCIAPDVRVLHPVLGALRQRQTQARYLSAHSRQKLSQPGGIGQIASHLVLGARLITGECLIQQLINESTLHHRSYRIDNAAEWRPCMQRG
jgi:hypothetical protein